MNHLSEVLKIMEGAWNGDTKHVENYAELLASKLELEGNDKQAKLVRDKILRMQGKLKSINIIPLEQTM